MLNNNQIKLVQTAVRGAGIRTAKFDGRYRMLLAKYKQSNGRPVTSCKQLNRGQIDDLLAICESLGWRHPGKSETYYRDRIEKDVYNAGASYAQTEAIGHLAGDLGMSEEHLKRFVLRMTNQRTDSLLLASQREAWAITEALKNMLSRKDGKNYQTLADVTSAYKRTEAATDGENEKDQEGYIRSPAVSHC